MLCPINSITVNDIPSISNWTPDLLTPPAVYGDLRRNHFMLALLSRFTYLNARNFSAYFYVGGRCEIAAP